MSAELSADPDLPLVRRAQTGDMDAFDELVRLHQSMITALLHRFAPTHADLEDLVQDTFVKVWRALPAWHPDKPWRHWLKRVAVNTALEFCRKRRVSPLARSVEPQAEGGSPLEFLAAPESAEERGGRALEEAQFLLSLLPPDDRALLTLLHLEQMPLAEIGAHFGWSRIHAKVKAFRARQRLQTLLKKNGYELP